MKDIEMEKDRLLRYGYVYKSRYTAKQKDRFLRALIKDISLKRKDVSFIEYTLGKHQTLKNVYVGDLQKAKYLICTYYDTPPISFSDYPMFQVKQQEKNTLMTIGIVTIVWVLLGIIGTWLLKDELIKFDMISLQTFIVFCMYLGYFWVLSKISKGDVQRHTLIRNTSSVLCILDILSKYSNHNQVAYAFLDKGCQGNLGLQVACKEVGKHVTVYHLDCIGAQLPLYVMGNQAQRIENQHDKIQGVQTNHRVQFIFCAKPYADDFIVPKQVLSQKQIQQQTYDVVKHILEEEVNVC